MLDVDAKMFAMAATRQIAQFVTLAIALLKISDGF